MITLAVPTLRRYDLLKKLVASAEVGTVVPDRYFIIDNGNKIDRSGFVGPADRTVIHRPGRNIGVAASFNIALQQNEDYIIISNDDVVLRPKTIESLVIAAYAHPEVMIFGASRDNMFSLFLQRKSLLDRIGEYDESFWPAYFEDNDYMRRIKLAKVPWADRVAEYDHEGSATVRAFNPRELKIHHKRFEENRAYYVAKWGGEPGHETVDVPNSVWKKSDFVDEEPSW